MRDVLERLGMIAHVVAKLLMVAVDIVSLLVGTLLSIALFFIFLHVEIVLAIPNAIVWILTGKEWFGVVGRKLWPTKLFEFLIQRVENKW